MTDTGLLQIASRTRHLLLDFDGPICSIYAGVTAAAVADELRRRLRADGIELPGDAFDASDPLEVFRDAAILGPHAAERAHLELTNLEVDAVATAQPTPSAADLITAADQTGRTVTIVSNNSAMAIITYLGSHDVPAHIRTIYGRDDADPGHMKPHPYRIHQAIKGLPSGTSPGHCALVGDSMSDVTAGHHAQVRVIGYATKAAKRELLANAGADAITADLADLAAALRTAHIAELART
jgi:beta-phosphoglucomutase-like phosphatase (HAD superfamily)